MVERHQKKLACFQKTRSGMVKKGDTTKASVPINSPFTLEELVHMIDVSINSKYGADLEGIMRTLTDGLCSSLESFKLDYKQDVGNNLRRQVRSMVQQVLEESRGKCDTDTIPTINPNLGAMGMGTQGLHLWQLGPGVGEQWLTRTFSSRITKLPPMGLTCSWY
jgi:hypothetical protein